MTYVNDLLSCTFNRTHSFTNGSTPVSNLQCTKVVSILCIKKLSEAVDTINTEFILFKFSGINKN